MSSDLAWAESIIIISGFNLVNLKIVRILKILSPQHTDFNGRNFVLNNLSFVSNLVSVKLILLFARTSGMNDI